jgi:hypothetical protein
MTLHVAIEALLREVGRPMSTHAIADELNHRKWYKKRDGSAITAFQIHGRTRNYAHIFIRDGALVSLSGNEIITSLSLSTSIKKAVKVQRPNIRDEHYALDLCDYVLNLTSSRQHRFEFLLGDANKNGFRAKLPVDAYYDSLNLVIEYRERQHTEAVTFFDKPSRRTISGVHRGEQRRIYDERRRLCLPQNGLTLIEISYSDFNHDAQGRIIRNQPHDVEVVEAILKDYLES